MGSAGSIRTIWPCATRLPIGVSPGSAACECRSLGSSSGSSGLVLCSSHDSRTFSTSVLREIGDLGFEGGMQRGAGGRERVRARGSVATGSGQHSPSILWQAEKDRAYELSGRHLQRITSTSLLECLGAAVEWRLGGLGMLTSASTSSDQLPESLRPAIGRKLSDSRPS